MVLMKLDWWWGLCLSARTVIWVQAITNQKPTTTPQWSTITTHLCPMEHRLRTIPEISTAKQTSPARTAFLKLLLQDTAGATRWALMDTLAMVIHTSQTFFTKVVYRILYNGHTSCSLGLYNNQVCFYKPDDIEMEHASVSACWYKLSCERIIGT